MAMNPHQSDLTLPRYAPYVLKGTVLVVWYDSQDNRYLVVCPKCHALITCNSLDVLYHEVVGNGGHCCQGCRARITFEKDPGLIGMFLDFWSRTGRFPESDSWLEAIPQLQLNLWAKEIRTYLEAEQSRSRDSKGGRQ